MATYASLSPTDKAIVQSTTQLIRALSGGVARMFNTIEAIADDTNAVNLIASLDPGEIIPQESGLSGADDLERGELVGLWNELTAMKATHDTAANRADWAKAAGAPNTLGVI